MLMPADSSNGKMSATSVIRVQVPDCSSQSIKPSQSSHASSSSCKPGSCPANHTATDSSSLYHHPYPKMHQNAGSSNGMMVSNANHHSSEAYPAHPIKKEVPSSYQSAQSHNNRTIVVQQLQSPHHPNHHHHLQSMFNITSEHGQTIITSDPPSGGATTSDGGNSVNSKAPGHHIATTQRVPHSNVIYVNNTSVMKNSGNRNFNKNNNNACNQTLGVSSCGVGSTSDSGNITQSLQRPLTPEYIKSYPVMDTTVASSVKGEPELNIEFDGTTVLCRVCGDKASGFHYGVHSCEGCKGFFRRSIQQKIQYRPCTKNQQCSILRINRNRCQYCRLKKCIAVGMSRDAVRFGRVPKREKARILAAMQQSTQNRGQQRALATELDDQPRLLAAVLRAHMETCEFTKEKVSAMRQRARECPSYSMPTLLACPLNPAPELQSELEFSQRFAHVIRGVIDFAGMIPGFQLLTQDDKFTLLKAGLFDALFVRLICMFDPSINSIICLNGQVMRRDAIQNGANARFLVDSTFNFAERINSMNLTDTEIGLFCAIVLITPDRPGLRNIELIEKMYTRLKACLQTVISQNRPNQSEFMSELLKTLPDLRTLSTLHTEKLVVFRTEHKELLRQQMWNTDDDHISKSPGSSNWDTCVEDVAKSPLGSVSSTESGDLEYSHGSLASSAPLLAATLSGTCPLRHRVNSGSSAEDVDIVVGSHALLTQNGLSITPVGRSHNSHSHMTSGRYRKLDSPTDSGIESGNEKAESTKTASSGGGSSCSSPRSTVEDVMDDQHQQHVQSGTGSRIIGAKRQICEDMPVLKRVLQAPPLYDTNSLMDEAYKPHKKFRALRNRDFESAEADTHTQRPNTASPPPFSTPSSCNANSSGTSTFHHQQPQSQLHMHLTRNTSSANSNQSTLSSTHSVLAKSLMEEPRMTAEQMKRSDIIQNYIMREQPTPVNGLLVCASSSPTSSTSASMSNVNNCSSSSSSTITLSSPPPLPPPHPLRWQSHSVITTSSLRNQSASPVGNAMSNGNYFQSPHSTSISSSPRASPLSRVQSPRLIELQVDIADSQQPLNLSKKSPTPPPSQQSRMSQIKMETNASQRSAYHHPVAADITVTTATSNSVAGASIPPPLVHKVLLEA